MTQHSDKEIIEGWEKEFEEMVYYEKENPDAITFLKTREQLKSFIRTLFHRIQQEENQAWLRGERCHTCGNPMKSDGLSDTCKSCFENS